MNYEYDQQDWIRIVNILLEYDFTYILEICLENYQNNPEKINIITCNMNHARSLLLFYNWDRSKMLISNKETKEQFERLLIRANKINQLKAFQ